MTFLRSAVVAFAALAALAGCSREEATKNYAEGARMAPPVVVPLASQVRYAQKRGFADFTCDGVEDMVEINDTAFFGQDYKIRVFPGAYVNNRLEFDERPVQISLPIKMKWFSDATKIDTADVNGDGCADVVFTQYTSGLTRDRLDYAFAINDRRLGFHPQYASERVPTGRSAIEAIILAFIAAHGSTTSSESLYDYLKMDWVDMDGNGSDDLVLLWDGRNDLFVEIAYTERTKDGTVQVKGTGSTVIPSFMHGRSIRDVDTADYDGDGRGDILVYQELGSTLRLSFALANGAGGFTPYKDVVLPVPKELDFFASATKRDSYDVDGDGKADFVIMGEVDDRPVRVVYKSLLTPPGGAR